MFSRLSNRTIRVLQLTRVSFALVTRAARVFFLRTIVVRITLRVTRRLFQIDVVGG